MAANRTTVLDFFQLWSRTFASGGMSAYGIALISSSINAGAEVSDRLIGGIVQGPARWTALIAIGLLGVGVAGVVSAKLARIAVTIGDVSRFGITWALLFTPALVALALASIPVGPPGSPVQIMIIVTGIGSALILVVMLPAWPIAQLTGKWFQPSRVFRATRGHRWPLIFSLFFGSSTSGLLPDYEKVHGVGNVVLLGIGHALFGAIWTVAICAIGVTAWLLAIRNDPGLRGSASLTRTAILEK